MNAEIKEKIIQRTVQYSPNYKEIVHAVITDLKYEDDEYKACTLVKYGKKFHPVKKYAVDLSEMTASNKKRYLSGDRKWYLKIEGLYRDFIEQDASTRNYQLSQEYCLFLTIRDPNGKAPVYDEIAQQLEYKNFVHHNIQLRNVVEVDEEV